MNILQERPAFFVRAHNNSVELYRLSLLFEIIDVGSDYPMPTRWNNLKFSSSDFVRDKTLTVATDILIGNYLSSLFMCDSNGIVNSIAFEEFRSIFTDVPALRLPCIVYFRSPCDRQFFRFEKTRSKFGVREKSPRENEKKKKKRSPYFRRISSDEVRGKARFRGSFQCELRAKLTIRLNGRARLDK